MSTAFETFKHLFAPLTANCRDFHRIWERSAGAAPPAGRWRGEWRSIETGHHGALLCAIETAAGSTWRAAFRAGYAGVFRACYAIDLHVTPDGDRWVFKGQSDIGWVAGGVYEYDGEATAGTFVSRYRSATDHGEFRLTRP
jgi:hypothetical protein